MTPATPPLRTASNGAPPGHPRGSWPADGYVAAQRDQGIAARVVMDLCTDQVLLVTDTTTQ
ncbi:hypothetical protein [Streptomyces sp. MN13]